MGLGHSIKMITLHRFRCPATAALSREEDIEFTGISSYTSEMRLKNNKGKMYSL